MGHGGQQYLGKVLRERQTPCSEKPHLHLLSHSPLGQTHLPMAQVQQCDLKDIGVSAVAPTLRQGPVSHPSPEHSCSQTVPAEQPESNTWQQTPSSAPFSTPEPRPNPSTAAGPHSTPGAAPRAGTAARSWARQLDPEAPTWRPHEFPPCKNRC